MKTLFIACVFTSALMAQGSEPPQASPSKGAGNLQKQLDDANAKVVYLAKQIAIANAIANSFHKQLDACNVKMAVDEASRSVEAAPAAPASLKK